MRIDSSSFIQRLQSVRGAAPVRRTEGASASGDAVEISSLAADMRVAMDALKNAPEIEPEQAERLDTLQQQIDSGQFDFSSGALASKFLP